MKKNTKRFLFLILALALASCSSSKKSGKCSGETCRIGDHGEIALINR